MTQEQYAEVEEYVLDHYLHFGFYPASVELDDGTVFTFDEYMPFV